MFNIRKKIIFSLISSLMIFALLACSSTELPDIDATVEARLAIIPTPTPQIITQEVEVIKEVIVEKEVPIETEVIKEVIVEKEVVIEVPVEKIVEVEVIKEVIKEVIVEKIVEVEVIKEVIKEVIVEKIVEVVVTATPTPMPTATPVPTPTPTPTPTPYTEVGGLLKEDTTWGLADSPYLVTEPIQIPDDVTLTIDAGVEVTNSELVNFMFHVHGTFRVEGTQTSPVYLKGNNSGIFIQPNQSKVTGLVDIRFAHIEGFQTFSNNRGSATFNVRDSVIRNIVASNDFASNKLLFERNRFENANGFSLSNYSYPAAVSFLHNCFVSKYSEGNSDTPWFLIVFPHNPQTFQNNAFLDTGEVAFKAYISVMDGAFYVGPNYYGTTDKDILDQMVYDRSDSLDLGFKIELTDTLDTNPVEGCP